MPATDVDETRGTGATRKRRLNNELFDQLTEQLGATKEVDRATLVGVDRGTLSRFRHRKFTPSLDVAMRMAEVLGTTVADLFGSES
jgi:DNA-binding XRE family transcriptional regulator